MNSIRPQIPDGLQRIVARCLKKQPEDRYPNAQLIADELRLLRRDTEAGLVRQTSWRQRLSDAWDELHHLPPGHALWYGLGLIGLVVALYWSLSRIGVGTVMFLVIAGFFLYRHVRNRPQRMQEQFVRRVSKIPEVRVIAFHDRQISVVIDRPVAQLYGRLHGYLNACNKRLYSGQPMTMTILHEVSPEQTRTLLSSPGVHYVRDDVVGSK